MVSGFNPHQLDEIRHASLARILCDNTDLEFVQRQPFLEADKESNPLTDCSYIPYVDLNPFKY